MTSDEIQAEIDAYRADVRRAVLLDTNASRPAFFACVASVSGNSISMLTRLMEGRSFVQHRGCHSLANTSGHGITLSNTLDAHR